MNITSQGFDGLYLLVDKAGMPVQRSAIVQGGRAPRFEGAKGYVTLKQGSTLKDVPASFYGLIWERQGLPDVPYKPAPKASDPLSW